MTSAQAKTNEITAAAEQAAQKAEQAIKSTQMVANESLNSISDSMKDAKRHISPLLNRAGEQASAIANRSLEAVRTGTQQLREKAHHAQDSTVTYIQNEPVKSVLIAAATGAALMAVVGYLARSRNQ